MSCRPLLEDDFSSLFTTFKSAFSNNKVKLEPSETEFRHRLDHKLLLDHSISGGYFDGANMIGFILHSAGLYEDLPTAYNGGTGVLPGFRNQNIAEQIYEYLIPKLRAKQLVRVLLEVIEENEYAIKLYEKIGFNFKRKVKSYQQVKEISLVDPIETSNVKIEDVNFSLLNYQPSFLDHDFHLKQSNETIIATYTDRKMDGYVIFQPHLGRISQLALSTLSSAERAGQSLLLAAERASEKPLSIMNIPEDQHALHQFLVRSGFENQVNQLEMELII